LLHVLFVGSVQLVERAHALEAQVSDLKGQLASAAVSKAALDEELAREKVGDRMLLLVLGHGDVAPDMIELP
jgi:hypothetical protein